MRNSNHALTLVENFPDARSNKFSEEEWISNFNDSNVIIHCLGKDIYYPAHWGPLSVKCAFNGSEYYQKGKCKYAVSEDNYLVLNEGTEYSSYIEPGREIESLTINFSPTYQFEVPRVLLNKSDFLLDNPAEIPNASIHVEEKLFKHNSSVSPHLFHIKKLAENYGENKNAINETFYFLLEAMLFTNAELIHEIKCINAARLSTKKEIYRRLNEVKDYIDSCFNEDISLEDLSKVALMSPFHLLRQFRKNYHVTPHQYLINRRLERAKSSIINSDAALNDISFMAGFRDASSFSKLFKKRFGLSPQQYREAMKR